MRRLRPPVTSLPSSDRCSDSSCRLTEASDAIESSSIAAVRAELVTELLRDPAGLIVLEDVHWFDPASRDLLASILDPLAAAGWLVIVVRRPDTAAITADPVSIELDPLADEDVERIAATASADHPLSDARLHAIVRRAGGNALFAAQLARSVERLDLFDLPESAERLVGARIDLLAPALRSRLRLASVLGARVDLELLSDVTGDPQLRSEESWEGLEEFVRHSPISLEFRHDLFRLAAYESLTFAERAHLHRAVMDVLERRHGTPPAVLAEHAVHAGRPEAVVHWATRAADDAAGRAAFVDEARLRRLAADNASTAGVARDERGRLYTALAHSYETLAERDAAEASYQKALQLTDPRERVEIRTAARLARVPRRRPAPRPSPCRSRPPPPPTRHRRRRRAAGRARRPPRRDPRDRRRPAGKR